MRLAAYASAAYPSRPSFDPWVPPTELGRDKESSSPLIAIPPRNHHLLKSDPHPAALFPFDAAVVLPEPKPQKPSSSGRCENSLARTRCRRGARSSVSGGLGGLKVSPRENPPCQPKAEHLEQGRGHKDLGIGHAILGIGLGGLAEPALLHAQRQSRKGFSC